MAGEMIKGETALAYEYFLLFLALDPVTRSCAPLSGIEVAGKNRLPSVIRRWHFNHDWDNRVNKWDIERSRAALKAFILRRNVDLETFIDNDYTILQNAQQIVIKKMVKLRNEKDPSATEFRTLMLGYGVVREGLKDLIGIFDNEADDASRSEG